MNKKLFSRVNLYLYSVVIGFLLILFGIYNLIKSFSEADSSMVWKSALILLIWGLFTLFNTFLYKKELKKNKK